MKRAVMVLASAAVVALAVIGAWAQSSGERVESGRQRAERGEGSLGERERETEKKRIRERLAMLRAGKSTVTGIGKLTVGTRRLVTVTVTRHEATAVLLIPQLRNRRRGPWQTHVGLLEAVRRLRHGVWEVIHSEEKYGLEWITGIGESSPETLEEMERATKGRRWEPEKSDENGREKKKDTSAAPVEGTAVGLFAEMGEGRIDGKTYKTIVVRRGVEMTRTVFWLARPRSRGYSSLKKKVIEEAAQLAVGDELSIEFLKIGDRYFVKSFKKK
ncbi:MAG: hypothetical protein GWP05_08930 [Anaerolineaceae bacterium]|nr:hypothetical protein [Anaerolineaceae bacterium]